MPPVSKDEAPSKASKQPSLLFAQGRLLQALRPQDFQKGRGGGANHSAYQVLPAPSCFLQEVGRERKWTSAPSGISPVFSHYKYSVVEEETEAHRSPQASASPRFNLLPPFISTPSRMSCKQPGEGLRSPSGGLWREAGQPGSRARGRGSRRRGVAGGAAAGWGGSALNRGPQLGFHTDSSGGQAKPSAVQTGKLRLRSLQSLGREGPSFSYSGPFIFPMKMLALRLEHLVSGHSMFRLRYKEWKAARSPGHRASFHS